MLSESSKSLSSVIRERLSSPLSGIFAISWLIFNWKGVSIFLFEEISMSNKLTIIADKYSDAWHNFWGPFSLTVCLLFIYPLLSVAAYFLWQHFSVAKRRIYIKVGGNVPLTLEESRALRQELEEKDEEIKKLTAFSSVKNKQLENENRQLIEVVTDKSTQIQEIQVQLNDAQSKLIELAAMQTENNKLKSELKNKSDELSELVGRNMILEGWLSSADGIKEYWRSKYFQEYIRDKTFVGLFGRVLDFMNGKLNKASESDIYHALTQDLIIRDEKGFVLTDKGKYISEAMNEEIPF